MSGLSAKTISLVLDLLFFIVVLIGFLWGIKRGLKKSVNRMLLIIISIAVSLIVSGLLTNMLFNMSLFDINGSRSIEDYLTKSISNLIGEGDFLTAQAVFVLAKGLINLIAFIVVFLIIKFITWIIYLIIMRDTRADKAEREQLKQAGLKPKKYRWWGGLVGAVQGALVALCLFIPISGISGVVADISNPTANATKSSQYEHSIVLDLVPKKYLDYVNVYENTITNKAFGWLKLDNLLFNTLTSGKVDGVRISFRNEVKSVNKIYSTLKKSNLIENDKTVVSDRIKNLSEEEFSSITNEISNSITSSKLIRFALVDISNYGARELGVEEKVRVKDLDWEKENEILSGALSDVTFSIKPVIANMVSSQNDSLSNILSNEEIDFGRFGKGIDKLKNMALFKDLYKPAFQKLLSSAQIIKYGDEIGFDFRKINITNVVWEKELGNLGKALKLANQLKDKTDLSEISGSEIKDILTSMGESQVGEEFDKLIAKELEEQYNVVVPDDFSITTDAELIETTSKAIDALQKTETGDALTSEQSSELLNIVETMPESETSQALLDAFAKEAGVEEAETITVASAKEGAELLNDFLTCEESENAEKATLLANALNSSPSCIKILKFRSNTYLISEEKYNSINSATDGLDNKEDIMLLFTVIGA